MQLPPGQHGGLDALLQLGALVTVSGLPCRQPLCQKDLLPVNCGLAAPRVRGLGHAGRVWLRGCLAPSLSMNEPLQESDFAWSMKV